MCDGSKVRNSLSILSCPFIRNASIVHRMNIARVYVQNTGVILNCFIITTHLSKTVSSVIESLDVFSRAELNFVVVVTYSLLVPFYFSVY